MTVLKYKDPVSGLWVPLVSGVVAAPLEDTGWVDINIASGFAAYLDKPQVRRVGSVVYGRGAWGPTGLVASTNHAVGTLPAEFWPPPNNIIIAGGSATSSTAHPTVVIFNSVGNVIIRTSASLPSWVYINALSYFLD